MYMLSGLAQGYLFMGNIVFTKLSLAYDHLCMGDSVYN